MMAYSEDHIALAAEYALGTLSAEEREQVDAMMSVDTAFAAVVESWERKLGVLNQMVGLVEPRPEVWEKIKTAIMVSGEQQAMLHPEAVIPMIAPLDRPGDHSAGSDLPVTETAVLAPAAVETAMSDRSNVIEFSRQARRWRGIATGMTAVAAALVAMIAVQTTRPDLLPSGLRPKTATQVAQAPTQVSPTQVSPTQISPTQLPATLAAAQSQYVALLQTDSTSPAFILTVDAATKNFTVRKVGAEQQAGKSYELWIVSDKLQRPRSLGVIGGNDFTTRAALAAYDPDTVSQATYAVTVEPEGGSPTGRATGPIVYTGKLIETVPAK